MRALLIVALACLPIAAQAAPANPSDLSVRLADLLRNLDHDQSRKLTRQIEPAQSTYTQADLEQVAAALNERQGRAVIVFGKRGPIGESPLDLEKTLIVSAPRTGEAPVKADAKSRRTAYLPKSRPEATWSGVLPGTSRGDASGPLTEEVGARTALDALAKSRSAAFVFLLSARSPAAGVEKLIVVPDTVKVTVTGDSVPAAASSRRAGAAPDVSRTMTRQGVDRGKREPGAISRRPPVMYPPPEPPEPLMPQMSPEPREPVPPPPEQEEEVEE